MKFLIIFGKNNLFRLVNFPKKSKVLILSSSKKPLLLQPLNEKSKVHPNFHSSVEL